ncbi:efflux RND transporter periplasmic adaptor subunit [Desulforhopalus vacuolatus]|uniref:efflux RND transporter periplasmic adaptor subunit n=1 Tax=Desulforhopalus vacuolatus TaxID=40414 RepID=UPI00196392D9|nr:efflux RND transporter periplasmic adaptor subunit [Desulforhopalus vacuolatus]MBM9519860.1 efflux RND transporter periplasmic adaptor subunit [Desulforhopalus vacuolatus]
MVSHFFLRKKICAYSIFFALIYANIVLARAQEHVTDNRIRAQLTSYQQTTLSSEVAANIAMLTLRDGESFDKNQVLVKFDCALLNAQLNKAKATAEVAQQGLKVSKKLEKLHSISSLEIAQAVAKSKETKAELEAMQVQVSKCSLLAPYTGKIAQLYVNAHQYVTPGTPLMDIVDTSRLEIKLIAPSSWLSWLHQDSTFSIQIEELGKTYQAQVVRLGARIDPVSQSLPITGKIEGDHEELLPGMSGWASFNRMN